MRKVLIVGAALMCLSPLSARADFVEVNPNTLTVGGILVEDGVTAVQWIDNGSYFETYAVFAYRTSAGVSLVHAFSCPGTQACSVEDNVLPDGALTLNGTNASLTYTSSILGQVDLAWQRSAAIHQGPPPLVHGCGFNGGVHVAGYEALGYAPDSSFAFNDVSGSFGVAPAQWFVCAADLHAMAVAILGGVAVS